jgi:hypothetical protein
MASLQVPAASAQPRILRKNGEPLPHEAIEDLKSVLKCEILIKGEVPEEAYRAAIHRWNEANIREAVCFHTRRKTAILTCQCSQSSSSVNQKGTCRNA